MNEPNIFDIQFQVKELLKYNIERIYSHRGNVHWLNTEALKLAGEVLQQSYSLEPILSGGEVLRFFTRVIAFANREQLNRLAVILENERKPLITSNEKA